MGDARGHNKAIDQKTLESVRDCAKEYPNGLRVKFNPNTFQHGAGMLAGYIKSSTIKIEDGKTIGDMTHKVRVDGHNNMDLRTDKTDKPPRRQVFSYDETDLVALRVDGWKVHVGAKNGGTCVDSKSYPSVPYIVNLLMDPTQKITTDSAEFGYIGREFFAH